MPRRNPGPKLRYLKKRQLWYIVWSDHGRSRERSTGTRDRQAAEIEFAEFLRLRNRRAGPCDPSEVLITELLVDYAQDRIDAAAPQRISYAIDALTEFWQAKTAADVTRETCRSYARHRGKSAGTIRRELGVLRAAINHVHREGRITRTIAVHLPDAPAARERWLTRSEVARLLKSALREPSVRLYLPLFIVTALYTGQRKSAVLGLRWSQVDLINGRIDFNAPGARRTNKRRSRIPVPAKLLGHLRRARARGTELGFVVNDEERHLKDIKKGFGAAARRAGLSAGVTPHILRHTCATWLMQEGVSIWEAAGFLGMTPETLQNVYGHHSADFMRRAAEALS